MLALRFVHMRFLNFMIGYLKTDVELWDVRGEYYCAQYRFLIALYVLLITVFSHNAQKCATK